MFGYQIFGPDDEQRATLDLARMIFNTHRCGMQEQGAASKLRYIGIGRSVYTLTWAVGSSNVHTSQSMNQVTANHPPDKRIDDFEVLELEFEEAYGFDFIRTLDKLKEH